MDLNDSPDFLSRAEETRDAAPDEERLPVEQTRQATKDYIAIITAGGHVSCFHAGMIGVARTAEENGLGVIGFKDGFQGAKNGEHYVLTAEYLNRYANRGGSVIGSSRERLGTGDSEKIAVVLKKLREKKGINVRGIVGMSGDDHLGQLHRLHTETGIPVVGWPKTIDNDLSHTYHTLGYPTAAMNAARAIRQGHDGAWTNNRVHIVTMFGRDTDWMVAAAGAWGAADLVVGGESAYDISQIYEKAAAAVMRNKGDYGREFAVIAVSEGTSLKEKGIESHVDEASKDGHGNPKLVPERLALAIQAGFKKIDKKLATSIDVFTYDTLRNCPPTADDAHKAYQAGAMCARKIIAGESDICVVIKNEGDFLSTAPLSEVARKRYLAQEGFMDYEKMQPTQAFVDYYTPLFGGRPSREEVLFQRPEERSV